MGLLGSLLRHARNSAKQPVDTDGGGAYDPADGEARRSCEKGLSDSVRTLNGRWAIKMKTDMKEDGILVRADLTVDSLVLVVEPMDEGFALQLASQVTEVRLSAVEATAVRMPDIQRNISEPVWIAWNGAIVTFESEHAPTFTFAASTVTSVERDYDAKDLRAKFEHLNRCFRAGEKADRTMIAGLTKTKEAIGKFVVSNRHSWTLKRDFFGTKNPGKANEFAARLEVLDEIDKILRQG